MHVHKWYAEQKQLAVVKKGAAKQSNIKRTSIIKFAKYTLTFILNNIHVKKKDYMNDNTFVHKICWL